MPIENPEKLLIKVATVLERLDIGYFVTGGIAVSIWGRPRATFDIDIVIQIIEPQLRPLKTALQQISHAGYLDEDMAKDALIRKGEFNFIEPDSGLKVDFWIRKETEYKRQQFKRRRIVLIHGKKIYFISPEDLILSKLQWYEKSGSSRHLEDIESVFKISREKLDMAYLKKWAKKLGLLGLLKKWT